VTRTVLGTHASRYRAVDTAGQTVDFLLSETRDITAAQRFFAQAIEKRGIPEKMTLDGYAASHAAVAELQEEGVCMEAKTFFGSIIPELV